MTEEKRFSSKPERKKKAKSFTTKPSTRDTRRHDRKTKGEAKNGEEEET